jgi:hypothetical protein
VRDKPGKFADRRVTDCSTGKTSKQFSTPRSDGGEAHVGFVVPLAATVCASGQIEVRMPSRIDRNHGVLHLKCLYDLGTEHVHEGTVLALAEISEEVSVSTGSIGFNIMQEFEREKTRHGDAVLADPGCDEIVAVT